MIYVVGGPPRCGKTELAVRLCRDHGLPFISTDAIWGVAEVALPHMAVPMAKGADRIPAAAELFLPFLDRLVDRLCTAAPDYLVEGELVRPRDVVRIATRHPTRSVFLIRSRPTVHALSEPPGLHPWLQTQPPETAEAVAEEVRAYSGKLAAECQEQGFPCIEVGDRFETAMREAARALGIEAKSG